MGSRVISKERFYGFVIKFAIINICYKMCINIYHRFVLSLLFLRKFVVVIYERAINTFDICSVALRELLP